MDDLRTQNDEYLSAKQEAEAKLATYEEKNVKQREEIDKLVEEVPVNETESWRVCCGGLTARDVTLTLIFCEMIL